MSMRERKRSGVNREEEEEGGRSKGRRRRTCGLASCIAKQRIKRDHTPQHIYRLGGTLEEAVEALGLWCRHSPKHEHTNANTLLNSPQKTMQVHKL